MYLKIVPRSFPSFLRLCVVFHLVLPWLVDMPGNNRKLNKRLTSKDLHPVWLLPSYLIICAHVQQDGEALLGRHPPTGCVQCQLSHWNSHSITAQVSQSQDPLSIRHTDSLWSWTQDVSHRTPQYALQDLTLTKKFPLFPQTVPSSPTHFWLSTYETLYCLRQI